MKKVLFLFAILLPGIGAMAQKVVYDETNPTGVRTVICEGMHTGVSDDMDVYVALAGFQYKSTIRYSLAVTVGSGHEVEIPGDGRCVLTLGNGKTLELPAVAGGASVLQQVDVEMSEVYQSFRRFTYYNVKAKELKKIGKNGIVQMEIRLSPGNYSAAFEQDALGSMLTDCLSLINTMFGK